MSNAEKTTALKQSAVRLGPNLVSPMPFASGASRGAVLDFSERNEKLAMLEAGDTKALENFVWGELKAAGADYGLGGYGEERIWYQRSPLFQSSDGPRIVHLGVDIWCKAGTAFFCPLDSTIHSLKDNANFGDYGPTIVLRHELDGVEFFSVWGHLTRESLLGKRPGQKLQAGRPVAQVGDYPFNGDWPPHLHLQLTFDMLGNEGDFPGVAAQSKKEFFLDLCPDPNILIRSPLLPA